MAEDLQIGTVYNSMVNEDLKSFAYLQIKRRLITCEYEPYSVLNEAFLSKELGVSRTPIRDAISRLEQEGLVRVVPKKGIFVSGISVLDINQMYQARELLEPFIAQNAIDNISREELEKMRDACSDSFLDEEGKGLSDLDTKLHLYLASCCNNKYFIDTMQKIWDQNTRIQFCYNTFSRFSSAQSEHLSLISAILEGNRKLAAKVMQTHVENCRKATMTALITKL